MRDPAKEDRFLLAPSRILRDTTWLGVGNGWENRIQGSQGASNGCRSYCFRDSIRKPTHELLGRPQLRIPPQLDHGQRDQSMCLTHTQPQPVVGSLCTHTPGAMTVSVCRQPALFSRMGIKHTCLSVHHCPRESSRRLGAPGMAMQIPEKARSAGTPEKAKCGAGRAIGKV